MTMERAVASSALGMICASRQEASMRRRPLHSASRVDSVATCSDRSLPVAGPFFATAALGVAWLCVRRVERRRCHRGILHVRPRSVHVDLPDLDLPELDLPDLDSISVALELAERVEDFEEAVRLRDRMQSLEEAYPFKALTWRQQRQILQTMDVVLRSDYVLATRISAVKRLQELASPPAVAAGAEDALYKALREVSGADAEAVRDAVAEALWACWLQSGDEETDSMLKEGMPLLELGNFRQAAEVFGNVIKRAPAFAEGWNQRATALFFMKDYEASISDCKEVLRLKPQHFGCLSGLGECYQAQGDSDLSMRCMRAALEVQPGLKVAKRHVGQATLQLALEPQVKRTVEALTRGDKVPTDPCEPLSCHWDLHQMAPAASDTGGGFRYFVRLSYTNRSSQPQPLTAESRARFYVLRYSDGEVVPFTRIHEDSFASVLGPNVWQFTLGPGDEYKIAWVLIVNRPLKGLTGGTVFEVLDESSTHEQPFGFLHAGLEALRPQDAEEVTREEVTMLGEDYYFTGQLDLRDVSK